MGILLVLPRYPSGLGQIERVGGRRRAVFVAAILVG